MHRRRFRLAPAKATRHAKPWAYHKRTKVRVSACQSKSSPTTLLRQGALTLGLLGLVSAKKPLISAWSSVLSLCPIFAPFPGLPVAVRLTCAWAVCFLLSSLTRDGGPCAPRRNVDDWANRAPFYELRLALADGEARPPYYVVRLVAASSQQLKVTRARIH